jgi:drug/metabolite transporter (DMT)-like permease
VDRRRAIGIALVAVSAAGFASGTIISKPVYAAGLDWLQLLSWRFAIGAALAWAWIAISPHRRSAVRRLSAPSALAALGLGVWYSGNAGTYYAGLESVPASLAGVLVYLYPPIVAVLSLRFATPLVGRRAWFALGIALLGVVLALGGIQLTQPPPPGAILLILASPLIYAGWILLSARLAGERRDRLAIDAESDRGSDSAAVTTTLMITGSAIVFTSGAILAGRPLGPSSTPVAAWPLLLAIGFASTFLAIQTFYAGARRIGAAQAALVATIEPLVIVTLAAMLLHDVLGPMQLVGAGLILVGVVVAQTGERPPGSAEPATPLDGAVTPMRSAAPTGDSAGSPTSLPEGEPG